MIDGCGAARTHPRARRTLAAATTLSIAAGLAGCFTGTRQHSGSIARPDAMTGAPADTTPPLALKAPFPQSVPDAVPRYEARSRSGNPPFYDVMGHRYYVLSSSTAYVERGVASWYGPGFDKVRTSTGDLYDRYGMSAAHKTLPLPAYVRVTNLQNGRSCVVRVNDRGPFVGNRIIDLSYTAAAKLDMLRNGTAFVEVRAIDPSTTTTAGALMKAAGVPSPAPAPAPAPASPAPPFAPVPSPALAVASPAPASPSSPAPAPTSAPEPPAAVRPPPALFVQAGAFADPANANRLADRLRDGGYGTIFVRSDVIAGRQMYRVRIGPVPTVAQFDHIVAALDQAGVRDAHLAMD